MVSLFPSSVKQFYKLIERVLRTEYDQPEQEPERAHARKGEDCAVRDCVLETEEK